MEINGQHIFNNPPADIKLCIYGCEANRAIPANQHSRDVGAVQPAHRSSNSMVVVCCDSGSRGNMVCHPQRQVRGFGTYNRRMGTDILRSPGCVLLHIFRAGNDPPDVLGEHASHKDGEPVIRGMLPKPNFVYIECNTGSVCFIQIISSLQGGKVVNSKVLIIAVLIISLFMIDYKPPLQAVVPSCFEKEDCKVPTPKGYCSVEYDCIVGKCYSQSTKCPELCYGTRDEDLDGFKDCKDSDCFNSPYCPCERKSYTECFSENCYCPENEKPYWYVFEEGHQCICAEEGEI